MILLLNIKNLKDLLIRIFSKDSEITDILLEILDKTSDYDSIRIKKILCHLFFDEYYLIFSHNNLEDLYIENNSKFTEMNTEGLDKYPKNFYVNILDSLVDFDITYEQMVLKKILPEGEERTISKK
jgi:hypothetical protein